MICSEKTIAEIPNEYRTVPFWSWNDELNPDELVRQIRAMKDAGIGGFFMHARSGLTTPYMGPRWFECVECCIREADRIGMDAYLYDEIGWPSGFGAGQVNGVGEAYRQKFLRYRTVPHSACSRERVVGYYTADGGSLLGTDPRMLPAGEILEVTYEVNEFYVDVLNPEVTEKFLAVTHQRYFDTLPPELRGKVKGVFTDEPQVAIGKLVWSPTLNAAFLERYGYDLRGDLPKLWLDLPGAVGFRVRFHGLVAELFSKNYTGRIARWCREHHWEFTGHQVQEINYTEAVGSNGAIMPHYRYYTIPGVDWLGFAEPSVYVFTQLASVAAQSGKKRAMVETFAMCGWNLNFRGMKHLYSQMQLLGANFLCTHLQSYSLRGMRKRDYPPSFAPHQPWWSDYRALNDEFARVNHLLAEGENPVDTLILHAQSSAWALYRDRMEDERINPLFSSIESLSELLYRNFIPFHYADESILGELGACENDGTLQLGKCRYRFLIIPESVNFTGAVWKLLHDFSGPIYRYGKYHNLLIDGKPVSPEDRNWFLSLPELPESPLPMAPILNVSGENSGAIRATRRIYENGTIYFLVNTSSEIGSSVDITFPAHVAALEAIDPATGTLSELPPPLHWEFPAAGTLLLRAQKQPSNVSPATPGPRPECPATPLPGRARLRLFNDNFLPLDRVAYSVDGGEFLTDDVSVIQWRLLAKKRPCNLVMRFEFEAEELPENPALVMENPERYRAGFNGAEFPLHDSGFVFDAAFRRIPLPPVRRGRNTIELAVRFEQSEQVYRTLERARHFETEFNRLVFDLEIETVYLAGKFGVYASQPWEKLPNRALRQSGSFRIDALPESVDPTDLAGSGLPFFAGKLALDFDFPSPSGSGKLRTDLDGANSVEFFIDGAGCGKRFFPPYESNPYSGTPRTVTMELTTSLRNLLGPFHLAEGESGCVGPLSFWKEPNGIVPWEAPEYHPGYCVVATGVRNSCFIDCSNHTNAR